MLRWTIVILMQWILVVASVSFAQERTADTRLEQATPGNCEMNAALLDSVRTEALEEARKNRVVIVIARLGDGEISPARNRRRLLIVKNYLSKTELSVKKIVTAEGERVIGYGRIELYMEGELRVVLLANRNKLLCVECCNPKDSDFYPNRRNK